ncbi:hypothetical protein Tco_0189371 [Tanacetum coccineum]
MYASNGPPSLSSTGMNSFTNEGTDMMEASNDHVYVQPPSYSGVGRGQGTSHNQFHDTAMHRELAQTDENVEEEKAPSFTAFGHGQGNSYTHEGNAIREGGDGQAPSVGAMARGNVSQPSGGVDPYTGDQAAPSRDALNKRESSQTAEGSSVVFEGADVQEFVGMSLVGKNFRKFYPNAYYKEKDADK